MSEPKYLSFITANYPNNNSIAAAIENVRYSSFTPELFSIILQAQKEDIYNDNELLKDLINDVIDIRDYINSAKKRNIAIDISYPQLTEFDEIPVVKNEKFNAPQIWDFNWWVSNYFGRNIEEAMRQGGWFYFHNNAVSVISGLIEKLKTASLSIDKEIQKAIQEQNALKNNIEIIKKYINNIYTAEIQKEKQKRLLQLQKVKAYVDEYNRRVAQLRLQAGQI